MKISKSLSIGDLSFKYAQHGRNSIGLIVSKHYGNAVSRNLFKRRCRDLFMKNFILQKASIALIVRPKKQNISFKDLDSAFKELYEQIFV